jgi:hypothetical protein
MFAGGKRLARLIPPLCRKASILVLFWAGLVHCQSPIVENGLMESFDCGVRLLIVGHFDKRKAAWSACIAIYNDGDGHNSPIRLEQFPELVFSSSDIQIADKNVFHCALLWGVPFILQLKRSAVSDARAAPPLTSGTIISSSTVTFESST